MLQEYSPAANDVELNFDVYVQALYSTGVDHYEVSRAVDRVVELSESMMSRTFSEIQMTAEAVAELDTFLESKLQQELDFFQAHIQR